MKARSILGGIVLILTIVLSIIGLNAYVEQIVERKIAEPSFVNLIAEKVSRPVVIFDQNASVLIDKGAMKLIEGIDVLKEGKGVQQIVVSPNIFLSTAPLLDSLDDDYLINVRRGKKFDWIYDLSPIRIVTMNSPEKPETKRFKLEIIK